MQYKLLNGQDGQPCGVTIVGQNIFIPLYEDNAEATVHVTFAKKRLRDEDPGPPPWANEPESKSEPQK